MKKTSGFTLVEMLIATIVMMAVTGAVFQLMNPTQGTFQAQPEVSDLQQRMRVGADVLSADLLMAGAGTYMGATPGALLNFFAPVMPHRRGDIDPDQPDSFRDDAISLVFIPPTPSQTTVNKVLGKGNSQEIDVNAQRECGTNKHHALCGFEEGMRVMIFDVTGTWDVTTITNVQDEALHLQHNSKLSGAYDSGSAVISQVATRTYYLKSDDETQTYQLMQYDGYQTDIPVVDNVVKLQFEYFGDPQPPRLIPNKSLSDTVGPWTTYGPKPPVVGADLNSQDEYATGENCTFTVSDGQHVPRLSVLGAGGTQRVKLTASELTDGPWCPNATVANRFDADLLRIRQVRVTLRVQAALAALRGPAGVLFSKGGSSTSAQRFVPDQEIRFDIAPRNMNVGR
ncbi:MAG: PilW family protein [Vicinamibacterales bacterium]